MKPRQLNLSDSLTLGSKERSRVKARFEPRIAHGGSESRGKRKTERPFSPKAPIHIVLKSKRAKGTWSLLHRKNASRITSMIYVYSARFKIHVYRSANVGNHLHLLIKAEDRKNLADYLRVLAGRIAVTVTGAQKHCKKIGKFWDHLCWSRLVKWGREFHYVQRYVFANELEAIDEKFRQMVLKNPYLIPDNSS
jgi:REP element-mobilizing transposase RayT